MATLTGPATYTPGLGAIVRAHRTYMGLSRDAMAFALDLHPRRYERIENNQRDCPPGLLDTIHDLADKFEADVSEAIAIGGDALDPSMADCGWAKAVAERAEQEMLL